MNKLEGHAPGPRQRDLLLEELKLIVQGWKDISNPKFKGARSLTPWEKERLEFAMEAIAECGPPGSKSSPSPE